MQDWLLGSGVVVVVVRGVQDISRTTLPDEAEAERYIAKLRAQGIPRDSISLYRTRLIRPFGRPF